MVRQSLDGEEPNGGAEASDDVSSSSPPQAASTSAATRVATLAVRGRMKCIVSPRRWLVTRNERAGHEGHLRLAVVAVIFPRVGQWVKSFS